LGTLKTKHSLDDADIARGLKFCNERGYIKVLNREDGQAMLPSDDGIRMFAQVEQVRLDEQEKKKWSRADKISLASLVVGVILFFLGYYIGDRNAKKSDNMPTPPQQTNIISTSSAKSP
jgi:hypothetical protein